MSDVTPFAPVADGNLPLRSNPYGVVEAAMLASMKRTRPWALFIAVLGYFAAAMMILGGLGLVALRVLAPAVWAASADLRTAGPWVTGFYMVLGAFCLPPSYLLGAYASSIGRYASSGGSLEGLADAVHAQSRYWRYIGISTAVIMGLYALAIPAALVVGFIYGNTQR